MNDLTNWEYIQDKHMNDYEESFEMTDEEYEEYLKSPCRNCRGQKRDCEECDV